MGKDVFGSERHACQVSGCDCKSYLCVIDTMTDEERAMTVVHHPRNHPGYVTCVCGHAVGQHSTNDRVEAPPAASGELRKCSICASRTGACRLPGEEGHLRWTEAYCPKCFTKPNAKGCKQLDSAGHWTSAAATAAMLESLSLTTEAEAADGPAAADSATAAATVCPPCPAVQGPADSAPAAAPATEIQ